MYEQHYSKIKRSGYIAYKKPNTYQRIQSVALGLSIAVIVNGLVYISQTNSILWIHFPLSLALAGFLLVIRFRTALARYQLIATLVVVIGLALSLSELPIPTRTVIVFSSTGILLLLSGVIVHRRHIHRIIPKQGHQVGS